MKEEEEEEDVKEEEEEEEEEEKEEKDVKEEEEDVKEEEEDVKEQSLIDNMKEQRENAVTGASQFVYSKEASQYIGQVEENQSIVNSNDVQAEKSIVDLYLDDDSVTFEDSTAAEDEKEESPEDES